MTSEQFWQWMSENSEELLQADGQIVADQIEERLSEYDNRLGVEVSEPGAPREMIITAWSESAAFPAVRELVAAAPDLPGWQIIPLKPPRGFGFALDVDGLRIDASELQFEPLSAVEDPTLLGIRIYVPNASADHDDDGNDDDAGDRLGRVLPLVLETGIGEEAAAQIDHSDFVAGPSDGENPLAIDQLLRYVQWHRKKHGLD